MSEILFICTIATLLLLYYFRFEIICFFIEFLDLNNESIKSLELYDEFIEIKKLAESIDTLPKYEACLNVVESYQNENQESVEVLHYCNLLINIIERKAKEHNIITTMKTGFPSEPFCRV